MIAIIVTQTKCKNEINQPTTNQTLTKEIESFDTEAFTAIRKGLKYKRRHR